MAVEEFSVIEVKTWYERTSVVVAAVRDKHVLGKTQEIISSYCWPILLEEYVLQLALGNTMFK